jgi:hypothetical protein
MGFEIINNIVEKKIQNEKEILSETIKDNLSRWLVNIVKNDEDLIKKKGFKVPEKPSVEITNFIKKPNELIFLIKNNLSNQVFGYSQTILKLNLNPSVIHRYKKG